MRRRVVAALIALAALAALLVGAWRARTRRAPTPPAPWARVADAAAPPVVDAAPPLPLPPPPLDASAGFDVAPPPRTTRAVDGRPRARRDAGATARPDVAPPPPPPSPELAVRTTPVGLVSIDGGPEEQSPTAMRVVAAGSHHIRVRYPALGGATGDLTVELAAGERRVLSISPSDLH